MKGPLRYDYHCSFCGKDQDQVQRLIAGPNFLYVCNMCVSDFNQETAAQRGENGTRCSFCGKSPDQVPFIRKGPQQIGICKECLNLCQEIIDEEQRLRVNYQL